MELYWRPLPWDKTDLMSFYFILGQKPSAASIWGIKYFNCDKNKIGHTYNIRQKANALTEGASDSVHVSWKTKIWMSYCHWNFSMLYHSKKYKFHTGKHLKTYNSGTPEQWLICSIDKFDRNWKVFSLNLVLHSTVRAKVTSLVCIDLIHTISAILLAIWIVWNTV